MLPLYIVQSVIKDCYWTTIAYNFRKLHSKETLVKKVKLLPDYEQLSAAQKLTRKFA